MYRICTLKTTTSNSGYVGIPIKFKILIIYTKTYQDDVSRMHRNFIRHTVPYSNNSISKKVLSYIVVNVF